MKQFMYNDTYEHHYQKQTSTQRKGFKEPIYIALIPLVFPYQYVWNQQSHGRNHKKHNRKNICRYNTYSNLSGVFYIKIIHVQINFNLIRAQRYE